MKNQHKNQITYKNQYSNIVFFNIDNNKNKTIYGLKEFVQSISEASFSSILTLASFLVCKMSNLLPPSLKQNKHANKHKQQFPNQALCLNHLYQPWCDYLVRLLQNNQVYQNDNKICFAAEVSNQFLDQIKQSGLFQRLQTVEKKQTHLSNNIAKQICKLFINPNVQVQSKQKKVIGLIWLSKLTLQQDIYHPKIHFPALLQGTLYEEGYQMMHFKVPKGHHPTMNQLMKFDAIILSGSSFSINQNIFQIQKFFKTLKEAYQKNKKLKILGLCFGHQAIAKYFGGAVCRIQKRITGLQKVHFHLQQIQSSNLSFMNISMKGGVYLKQNQLELMEYHIDEVSQISEQFLIIGSSSTCKNEIMISNDKRILSYQFHMEYSSQYVRSYQIRVSHYKPNEPDYVLQKSGFDKTSKSQGTQKSFLSLLQMRRISNQFIKADL